MTANSDVDADTTCKDRNDTLNRFGRVSQLSFFPTVAALLMIAACNQFENVSPIEDAVYLKCDFTDLLWQETPGPSGSLSLIIRPVEKRIEIVTLHPRVSNVFEIASDNGFALKAADSDDGATNEERCMTELWLHRHGSEIEISDFGCKVPSIMLNGSCSKIDPIF